MISVGRVYAVEFHAVSVSAQQDFFYIKPAADKICLLEAVYLSNVGGGADAGDAQEELYRIEVRRVPATVTVGSGGSSVSAPNPLVTNDTAASFTARINDTTPATSSGTILNLHSDGMNVRVPYVWIPPQEHPYVVANAQAIVVTLLTTPADAVTMNGTAIVRELP